MVVFFSRKPETGIQSKKPFHSKGCLNDVVFFREEPTLSAQNSKQNSGKDPLIRYPFEPFSLFLLGKENSREKDGQDNRGTRLTRFGF